MSKKIIIVVSVIVALVLLAALGLFAIDKILEDIVTTESYEQAEKIYKRAEKGKNYTKKEIMKKLGCPEYCYDTEGNAYDTEYYRNENYTKEECEDIANRQDVVTWLYSFYRYTDPEEPYSFKITFDEKGKVIKAELEVIPGG